MAGISNAQIYNEFKQLRITVQGNGNPEESILWQTKETAKDVRDLSGKLDEHIKCGKGKKILGMGAELRSTVVKNAIRIVNFSTAAALLYLASWLSKHGVEIETIMKQVMK